MGCDPLLWVFPLVAPRSTPHSSPRCSEPLEAASLPLEGASFSPSAPRRVWPRGGPGRRLGGRRRVRPSLGHCGAATSSYSGHSACQAGLSTWPTAWALLTAPSPCPSRPEVLMAPTAWPWGPTHILHRCPDLSTPLKTTLTAPPPRPCSNVPRAWPAPWLERVPNSPACAPSGSSPSRSLPLLAAESSELPLWLTLLAARGRRLACRSWGHAAGLSDARRHGPAERLSMANTRTWSAGLIHRQPMASVAFGGGGVNRDT